MASIFMDFVNMSLTACWLILAVALLRLIFKRAPRWVFCLLWGFVGLRLVLPFSIESIFSLIPTKTPVREVTDAVNRVIVNTGRPINDLPLNEVTVIPPVSPVTPDVGGSVSQIVTPPAAKETLSIAEILAVVWVCGIVALIAYAAVSYLLLRHKIRTATRLESNVWQSEAVSSPFVLGFVKPRIYLPYALDKLDIPYVLAHERAHISRRDHLIKPLGFMILAVYWFNPVIWLAYILLCRDVELACDEKVIKTLGKNERRDYSTALLNCSVSRARIAACPIAFGEVAVKERIKGVMNYKKPAFWIIILAVIAIIVTAVCFLTDPKSKDKGKEDDVKEKEKETISYDPVKIEFSSFSVESGGVELELISETIDPKDPIIEYKVINIGDKSAVFLPEITLRREENGTWVDCPGIFNSAPYESKTLKREETEIFSIAIGGFDLGKAGKYCLEQTYYYLAYDGERKVKARLYFDLAEPIKSPLDDEAIIATDLAGYMNWLPEFIRIPSYSIDEIYYTNPLYLAARYSYENDMSFVEKGKDGFTVDRKDLVAILSVLSGMSEEDAEDRIYSCYKYVTNLGDVYDPQSDKYTFKLDRENWGETDAVSEGKTYYLDPSKPVKISEDDRTATATAYVTHPYSDNGYYEAEFHFKKVAAFDRVVYQLLSVGYLDRPITTDDISVTTTQSESVDGVYTEFVLRVRDREVFFSGRSREITDHMMMSPYGAIAYQDLTGDGYYDVIVLFDLYEDHAPYEQEHCESVHIFDGVTLEEYPVSDIMSDVLNSVKISENAASYTFNIAGEKYTVEKTEYDKYLPDLTKSYYYNTYVDENSLYLYVDCVTGGSGVNYNIPAHLLAKVDFKDGEFVLGEITFEENRGDAAYNFCDVHASGYHYGVGGSFLSEIVGYENYENWMYDMGEEQYENNGCTEAGNIYSFAVHFGLTQKQLRDNYYLYSYDYYWNYPDPTPLFEMDEKGCDEFFRDLDMKQLPIMQCRYGEYDFKRILLEGLLESGDPVKRTAYYKFNIEGNNTRIPFWSIAELVYEAELTLEELETLYSGFTKDKENLFEYDFARLFSDREYFENLIETAEYPVFVDEALRK